MTKSELIEKITAEHSDKLTKKDVKGVMETLATIGYKELKKTGAFLVPGFAKFVVVKKPATKARKGINPFTKEPMEFKARPARKVIRASREGSKRRGVTRKCCKGPERGLCFVGQTPCISRITISCACIRPCAYQRAVFGIQNSELLVKCAWNHDWRLRVVSY